MTAQVAVESFGKTKLSRAQITGSGDLVCWILDGMDAFIYVFALFLIGWGMAFLWGPLVIASAGRAG